MCAIGEPNFADNTFMDCGFRNALVLSSLLGFEDSVNWKRKLALSRKIGKSAFPSLHRASKSRVFLMRRNPGPEMLFSESYTGKIPASKNQKMSAFLILGICYEARSYYTNNSETILQCNRYVCV